MVGVPLGTVLALHFRKGANTRSAVPKRTPGGWTLPYLEWTETRGESWPRGATWLRIAGASLKPLKSENWPENLSKISKLRPQRPPPPSSKTGALACPLTRYDPLKLVIIQHILHLNFQKSLKVIKKFTARPPKGLPPPPHTHTHALQVWASGPTCLLHRILMYTVDYPAVTVHSKLQYCILLNVPNKGVINKGGQNKKKIKCSVLFFVITVVNICMTDSIHSSGVFFK